MGFNCRIDSGTSGVAPSFLAGFFGKAKGWYDKRGARRARRRPKKTSPIYAHLYLP